MFKIRRIQDFQHSFPFASHSERFDAFYDRFLKSDLGKIYTAVPWDRMASTFGLADAVMGPTAILGPKGKLALMSHKAWARCSDARLVKQLIGNLDRPYIRPIVGGKEKEPVEFGAKVHKFQIDGIGFVEHLSFDGFNEGIRFQKTVFHIQRLTGTRLKIIGASAIYANNKNRRFVTKH